MNLCALLERLRELSKLSLDYPPQFPAPESLDWCELELHGFTQSKLLLTVHKETIPTEFAIEQANFMMFLGTDVCPRVLLVTENSYVMEYLKPYQYFTRSLCELELLLEQKVWHRPQYDAPYAKIIGDESWREELFETINVAVPDWAIDKECLIHGDSTLDNTLTTRHGFIRVGDPIPPHRLHRPSIQAIDHGKMLQSMLGWEIVLRGMDYMAFSWPKFMQDYEKAKRATFWCMVALERIRLRNGQSSGGKWATRMAGELKECVSSF